MPTWMNEVVDAMSVYWNDMGYDKDQIADNLNFEYPDYGPFTGAVVHRKITSLRMQGKVFKDRPVSVRVRQRTRQEPHEIIVMSVPISVETQDLVGGVPFDQATRKQCQWIDGDPKAGGVTMVCGKPVVPGKPYCAEHCARAYRAPYKHEVMKDDKHA